LVNRLFLIIGILLLSSNCFAVEFTLTAKVNRQDVSLSDRIVYQVVFKGKDVSNVPDPSLPNLSGKFVVISKSESTSFSYVNGQVSSAKTKSYVLRPLKTGDFSIGSTTVTYKGQVFKTNPIQVTVFDTTQKKPTSQPFSSKTPRTQESATQKSKTMPNIFVKSKVSKKTAYVGEEIIYTVSLYRRVQLWSDIAIDPPLTKGFWVEEFPRNNDQILETVNGVRYYKVDRYKASFFPIEGGTFEIPKSRVGFVTDPFKGQQVLETKPRTVTVKPLPKQGRPTHFSGIVGKLNLSASTQSLNATQNIPVPLTITVSGLGHLKNLNDLTYTSNEYYKIYKSKIEDVEEESNNTQGKRLFHYFIIPKVAGTIKIPGFSTNYFSPKSRKFNTIQSGPIELNVALSKSPLTNALNSQNDIEIINNDIAYLKTVSLKNDRSILIKSHPFKFLIWINMGLLLGLLVWKIKPYIMTQNADAKMRADAYKNAVETLTQSHNISNSYQILLDYLNQKTGFNFSGMTSELMSETLQKMKVPDSLITELHSLIETLSFSSYSPNQSSQKQNGPLIEKVKTLLQQLEGVLQ